ncbi:dioxygenase [Microbacterium caowuchunii]|uniref:dioxygenase n=1 Tax=Microbacterium caowuchunii TaxID=2614638 RepID=UPI001245651F|nr:dioxygenase [Microbacterium caowuchunii]QEW00044.1 dioxygenase [Microbacterium caowuchunii]
MASGRNGRGRGSAQERERARLYQARRDFHRSVARRRTRDNVLAGVVGGFLILAVIGGQVAYFTMGPGTPAPSPAPSTSTTPPAGPLAPVEPTSPVE